MQAPPDGACDAPLPPDVAHGQCHRPDADEKEGTDTLQTRELDSTIAMRADAVVELSDSDES
eukprot:6471319-Amphidinium_carterae.1